MCITNENKFNKRQANFFFNQLKAATVKQSFYKHRTALNRRNVFICTTINFVGKSLTKAFGFRIVARHTVCVRFKNGKFVL